MTLNPRQFDEQRIEQIEDRREDKRTLDEVSDREADRYERGYDQMWGK